MALPSEVIEVTPPPVIEGEAIEGEVIEETPPPPKPVEDYAVVNLNGAVDAIIFGAERYPLDTLLAALSLTELSPEKLEQAAAFLMRLAEAMRRKAAEAA